MPGPCRPPAEEAIPGGIGGNPPPPAATAPLVHHCHIANIRGNGSLVFGGCYLMR